MGAIHSGQELLHPLGGARAAARDAPCKTLNEAFDQAGEHDRRQHQQTDDAENRQTGLEEIVEGDAEHEAVLGERFPCPKPDGEGSGNRKEPDGRDERDEDRAERNRNRHSRPFHDPDGHRGRPGLEGREVRPPSAEATGENHVPQPDAGMYVASANPETESASHPVHGREDEPNRHPAPVQLPKRREEHGGAVAFEDQVIANEECDSAEGDGSE